MNNEQCAVFLKETVKKTHFDPFSAVSAAPEACELSCCAEFAALPIYELKTTRRAQKMQKKRARECARANARFPEPLKTPRFPYTNHIMCDRNTSFFNFHTHRAPWPRNKGGVFIYDILANKLQNLSRIRADLAKL